MSALQSYPTILIEDNRTKKANSGNQSDNSFTLNWRCGTAEIGSVVPMNSVKLIDQDLNPVSDRYVANVLLELKAN